jgi:glycosyltransferase involved in cell wall biosynthesis
LEALACGTPVVAFPSGALADLVEEGVTGYLVRNVSEMADAIGTSRQLSPELCRAAARARFSSRSMVACYLDLYNGIADDATRAEPTVPSAATG